MVNTLQHRSATQQASSTFDSTTTCAAALSVTSYPDPKQTRTTTDKMAGAQSPEFNQAAEDVQNLNAKPSDEDMLEVCASPGSAPQRPGSDLFCS